MNRLIKKGYRHFHSLSLTKKCVFISVLMHLFLFLFFFETPLLIRKKENSFFQTNALLSSPVMLKDESEYQLDGQRKLRDFFSHFEPLSSQKQKPYDLLINVHHVKYQPRLEEIAPAPVDVETHIETLISPEAICEYEIHEEEYKTILPILPHQVMEHLIHSPADIDKGNPLAVTPTFNLPLFEEESKVAEAPFHYDISALAKESAIESPVEEALQQMEIVDNLCTIPTLPSEETLALEAPATPSIEDKSESTLIPDGVLYSLKSVAKVQELAFARNSLENLEHYNILDQIALVGWSEHFDATVHYSEKPDEKGYFFSITLNPNFDMSAYKVKQNFYFMIDRSNSIEKHRFAAFKKGVLKALQGLDKEDHFNLCIFDSKMYLLCSEPVAATKDALYEAEKFLENQQYKSLFSATDIYDSLLKMIPLDINENVVNTSILITDGGTLLSTKKLQHTIKTWLERNNHKTNLFAATVGDGNNLTLLDLITTCSQGSVMHSDTYSAFPRKLGSLVKQIKNPLAKQVIGTTISKEKGQRVVLHTILSKLPNLFCNRPYVITGETNSLEPFTLMLQAKHQNQFVSIEKEIVFDREMKSSYAEDLCKIWKSHLQYEKFLKDGKESHLAEAEKLMQTVKQRS